MLSAPDGTFRLPATWDDCRTSQQVGLRWNQDLRSQELDAADTNGDGFADFLVAFNADNVDSVILRNDVLAEHRAGHLPVGAGRCHR